jgi:uncharacterized DUF497 family protein
MISWDENKRQKVLFERGIDFEELEILLSQPYIEDQKSDDPEQYKVVGLIGNELVTFVLEYEEDELGELIWVVTAWHSSQQEKEDYEQEIERR